MQRSDDIALFRDPRGDPIAALEDWMLEIATEDQGWVHEAAKFASRLLRDSDEQSRQRAVTNALMELLSANLIEIGESKNNSFRPFAEPELNNAMVDPQTWAYSPDSSSPELI